MKQLRTGTLMFYSGYTSTVKKAARAVPWTWLPGTATLRSVHNSYFFSNVGVVDGGGWCWCGVVVMLWLCWLCW